MVLGTTHYFHGWSCIWTYSSMHMSCFANSMGCSPSEMKLSGWVPNIAHALNAGYCFSPIRALQARASDAQR
jgi:hypothetical protein